MLVFALQRPDMSFLRPPRAALIRYFSSEAAYSEGVTPKRALKHLLK